jgi:prepilin-type N-terminal cleavage/methylation domain-containing protein
VNSQDHKHFAESGFTLVELLVATAMMVIIVGAAVMMLTSVMHREPKVAARANQIGNARDGIERITADLRQGEGLTTAEPSSVTVNTLCGQSGECSVSYSCGPEAGDPASFECVRQVRAGASSAVLSGLASPEIFCFYPNAQDEECGEAGIGDEPTYVGIRLQFPQENNETENSVLEGGVALHNAIIDQTAGSGT